MPMVSQKWRKKGSPGRSFHHLVDKSLSSSRFFVGQTSSSCNQAPALTNQEKWFIEKRFSCSLKSFQVMTFFLQPGAVRWEKKIITLLVEN
jgi:hypothetical protein